MIHIIHEILHIYLTAFTTMEIHFITNICHGIMKILGVFLKNFRKLPIHVGNAISSTGYDQIFECFALDIKNADI